MITLYKQAVNGGGQVPGTFIDSSIFERLPLTSIFAFIIIMTFVYILVCAGPVEMSYSDDNVI